MADIDFSKYTAAQLTAMAEVLESFDRDAWRADILENGLCTAPSDVDKALYDITIAIVGKQDNPIIGTTHTARLARD